MARHRETFAENFPRSEADDLHRLDQDVISLDVEGCRLRAALCKGGIVCPITVQGHVRDLEAAAGFIIIYAENKRLIIGPAGHQADNRLIDPGSEVDAVGSGVAALEMVSRCRVNAWRVVEHRVGRKASEQGVELSRGTCVVRISGGT